jgi:hypothetical protein
VPLVFQNPSGQTVYLAVLVHSVGCGPTNRWRKVGWYAIPNGRSFTVIRDDLRPFVQLMAWFASWWQDGPSWHGTGNQWYRVSNGIFDQCYDDNTNCDAQYNFQNLNFNQSYGITVTLLAPGQQEQPGQFQVATVLPPRRRPGG